MNDMALELKPVHIQARSISVWEYKVRPQQCTCLGRRKQKEVRTRAEALRIVGVPERSSRL